MTEEPNHFALPVSLDAQIVTSSTFIEYGEDGESFERNEDEVKSLGLVIAEQTAELIARTVARAGGITGSVWGSGVDVAKIINERVEEAANARVQKLIEEKLDQEIIRLGLDLEQKRVKWRNKSADFDEEDIEARTSLTVEEAFELLIDEWFQAVVEDKNSTRDHWGTRARGSRISLKIGELVQKEAEAAADKHMTALSSELRDTYRKKWQEKYSEARKTLLEAAEKTAKGFYLEDGK